MRKFCRASASAIAMLFAPLLFCPADAQNYPVRTIKLVTGYGQGSPPDFVSRYVATKLAPALGQPVVIENRVGAGSTLGAPVVARSAPDGYTLLVGGTSDLAVAPAMSVKLQYDPINDFAPIILATSHPNWLVIDPKLPVASLNEFVQLAKAKPGQLNYGSAGTGHLTHLAIEQLKAVTGMDIVHVPYKAITAVYPDLMTSRLAMSLAPLLNSQQLVADKRLRALAVTAPKRTPLAPDVPTVAEAGFKDMDIEGITAFLAPARVPREIITLLNREIGRILAEPNARQELAKQAAEPLGGTPEELAARLRTDLAKWTSVVKSANIKVD